MLRCGILLALVGCVADDSFDEDTSGNTFSAEFVVDAEVAVDIPTVITVRWDAQSADDGWVQFNVVGEDAVTTSATATDEGWEAVLLGVPPDSDVDLFVGEGTLRSETLTVTTGSAPSWVPDAPEATGPGPDGFIAGAMRTPDMVMAIIVDRLGRPVWWWPMDTYGADGLSSRVTLSPSKDAVWFNIIKLRSAPEDADAELGVVRVSLDGTEVEHFPLDNHHHDFLLRDDGTIVYLAYTDATDELPQVDAVMQQTPDGTPEMVWSSEDVLTSSEQNAWLNTLEYVEEDDTYWVSATGRNCLAVVDATSGALQGIVGGELSDLDVDDPFYGQHGFDVLDDELLLFDNGNASQGDSRAIRYAIDWEAGTATTTWTHHADPPLYSTFLGDALDLGDGTHLVNWTTHGRVHVANEASEVLSSWQYDEYEYLTFLRYAPRLLPQ